MTIINPIFYVHTASGVTGVIAGQYHAARDPQELLDRASRLFPRLLFKLVDKNNPL